jgi:hypothetical protein
MRLFLFLPPLLLLAACHQPAAGPQAAQAGRGNLTLGGVQAKIVNGTTTKAQVMEGFGSPNRVTRTEEGDPFDVTCTFDGPEPGITSACSPGRGGPCPEPDRRSLAHRGS